MQQPSPLPAGHLRRRALAAAVLAWPALRLPARAQATGARRPTPAQAEGPFYPVSLPADHDADLLRNGAARYAQGSPTWLEGAVTDLDGRPLQGAEVEIWQCDARGHYHHPGDGNRADPDFQGYGRVRVDAEGRYRFHTIRPVAYGNRAPHIHLKVRHGGRTLLTTQVYVQGDAGNARDFLWRSLRSESERDALTLPFVAEGGTLRAFFPVAVAGG